MSMIDGLASKGRKGDTEVVHATKGEVMVPREVLAMRPDLVAHIGQAMREAGGDPSKIVVGRGRRNPNTGMEEFATADEIKSAYQQYLGRDATDSDVTYWSQNAEGFGGGTGGAFQQGVANERSSTGAGASATYYPGVSTGGGMVMGGSAPPPRPVSDGNGGYTTETGETAYAPGGGPNEINPDGSLKYTSMEQQWDAKYGSGSQGNGELSAVGDGAAGEIQTWYRNLSNRDPDSAGLKNWTDYYAKHGRDSTFQAIAQGMKENEPTTYKPLTLADASKAYTGYQSSDGTTTVDEWARNNFGREATADERQRYGSASTGAQAQAMYQQFLEDAKKAGEVGKGLSFSDANQLKSPLRNDPRTGNLTFIPNTNSQIDAATETIEGRLGNLLALDANGNYTNQVVRQAHDRAKQRFAARGLLNSSMAVQAGQEAVISRAIEIAGPDAERYFQNRRANVDSQNTFARDELSHMYRTDENSQQQAFKREDQDFAMRQDYQKAVQNVSTNYQKQLDTVNASNMTPADKSTAIAQITQQRDGELAYLNNVYSRMPRWQSEWASAAVPTDGVDIAAATNVSMLENIANDPAQPAAKREAARARIAQLRAASPAPAPAPAAPAPASETGMAFA